MSTGDELREALAALPNRRATIRAFADMRNAAPDAPTAAFWNLLMAELADIDDAEQLTLRQLGDDLATPTGWPPE